MQAGFWLTEQERKCILLICAIFLLGMAARYLYLKSEKPEEYNPDGIGQLENNHE